MSKLILKLFLIIFILGVVALGYYIYDSNRVVLNEVTLYIKDLPKELEGFKILHITDLHAKRFGTKQSKIINLIKDKQYDVACLTGDYVHYNDQSNAMPIKEVLRVLKPRYGIYGTDGNHDPLWYKSKIYTPYIKALEEDGYISVLQQYKIITHNGKKILITGSKTAPDKELDFIIRLFHRPNNYMNALKNNIQEPLPNLYLSGHTHGGQIRLPFIGAVYAPQQGLFPKYVKGFYSSEGKNLFICSGLGTTVIPLRINCTPEIALITLKRQ